MPETLSSLEVMTHAHIIPDRGVKGQRRTDLISEISEPW